MASLCSVASLEARAQAVAMSVPSEIRAKGALVSLDVENVGLERVLRLISEQAGLKLVVSGKVLPSSKPTTVHLHEVGANEAYAEALVGTRLKATIVSNMAVLSEADANIARGIVVGTVVNEKTKQPIRGAAVTLDESKHGVTTDEHGAFRFANVAPGKHTVRVRMIGYGRVAKSVTVEDGETASLTVSLAVSAVALDQVVVTGTVAATELRAIPNAITVITAKDIEQRGITRIDQLFRGYVPGVWAKDRGEAMGYVGYVEMESRGATSFQDAGGGSSNALGQTIKTYVDGIELADPNFLGLIDPKSIERIEILTGPQASTIYGSNAINGVMQVFTKRGSTARPQVNLRLQTGLIQNSLNTALTSTHDDAIDASGVSGTFSYNIGGSRGYMGPWSPAVHSTTTNGFAGERFQQGPLSLDASFRTTVGTNRHDAGGAVISAGVNDGTLLRFGGGDLRFEVKNANSNQTQGLTINLAPVTWWSHTLTVGTDQTKSYSFYPPQYLSISDVSFLKFRSDASRTTIGYNSTVRFPLTSVVQVTLTAGADGNNSANTSGFVASTNGDNGSASYTASHDRGMFLQDQVAIWDAVFFTYGLRAEWNPNYGAEANPYVAPRYGMAVTRDLGPVTTKMRASYGASTRPPGVGVTKGILESDAEGPGALDFPPGLYAQFPNPEIVPESQKGWEGGLETYFGTRGSLSITRYNQTVDNLIARGVVDSVDALPEVQQAHGWRPWGRMFRQFQNLNMGSIRNTGWELRGNWVLGPLSTNATYSWTKSRIIGMTPKYRAQFPQYMVGSPFALMPEHTYSVGVHYVTTTTMVGLDLQGQGLALGTGPNGAATWAWLDRPSRLPNEMPRISDVPQIAHFVLPGYTKTNLNASRRLRASCEGTLQVDNLLDSYAGDYNVLTAQIGRQTKLGLRIRW